VPSKPRALGAYIFAGGFTLGVRRHFDVLAHFEDGPFGAATARHNLGLDVFTNNWPVGEYAGRVDLLYANPPCAPFSAAGNLTAVRRQALGVDVKYKADPRVSCIHRTLETGRQLGAPLIVFESVQRAFTVARPLMDELAQWMNTEGYHVTHLLIDAQHCGLPQRRARYFFVASRFEFHPEAPSAPRMTMRDAFIQAGFKTDVTPGWSPTLEGKEFPNLSAIRRELYGKSKPGEALHRVFEREYPEETRKTNKHGQVVGRPGFLYTRTAWDRTVGAISGGAVLLHPDEPRYLAPREMQVLCGYPADYVFHGALGNQYAEIAKGVTPAAAEYVAGELRHAFDQGTPLLGAPSTSVFDYTKGIDNAAV
jgi:DNA (cytosine-5)-methyltransferase 1